MDDDRAPALRASDADRERTANQLRHAAGEGRLTLEELDERLGAAYEARTAAELERLTADVVVPSQHARDGAPTQRMPVRPGAGGIDHVVSIMGGSDRKGRWRVAERCRLLNVMGGSDIDLNYSELSSEHT